MTAIDPLKRRVTTEVGSYEADFLVVALGRAVRTSRLRRGFGRAGLSITRSQEPKACERPWPDL